MWRALSVVIYLEAGAEASIGEDLAMLRQLREMGRVEQIGGAAYLHVYICHGGNTSGDEHHRMLIDKLAVSKGVIASARCHCAMVSRRMISGLASLWRMSPPVR
jgi:hypothetical protein